MRLFFLLFPWFLCALHDSVLCEEGDPALVHHVNVISGHLELCLRDVVAKGPADLEVIRTYSSAGALDRDVKRSQDLLVQIYKAGSLIAGGWNLFPHIHLSISPSTRYSRIKVYIPEPSGALIPYVYDHRCPHHKHVVYLKSDYTHRQHVGKMSRRTNPQYNKLRLDLKQGEAALTLSDGGTRVYKGNRLDTNKGALDGTTVYYLLDRETLPNGHTMRYYYEGCYLSRIEKLSPDQKKVFSSLSFQHEYSSSKKKNIPGTGVQERRFLKHSIATSDGKNLAYHMLRFEGRDYISEMSSSCHPHEKFHLIPGRKHTGARIQAIDLGGKGLFGVSYHLPPNQKQERKWAKHPEKKEFHIDKVLKITAAKGAQGQGIPIAQFDYRPGQTDVRDAEGALTRFHYDDDVLSRIEYFDKNGALHSSQKLYWAGNYLRTKALFDASGAPLFAKSFRYEEGNVAEETLFGSLTGKSPSPLYIDADGKCSGSETQKRTYSYYPAPFHLLKSEAEEGGTTSEYTYKPGTDLCTSKITRDADGILIRELFTYDADHLLIRKITDDGNSPNPDEMQGVKQRTIKTYERSLQNGMPEWVIESYWDPQDREEHLLRKTKYTYQNMRPVQEEVFDAEGAWRYTLYTEYNSYGKVTRKTTPLGKENSYGYNAQGDLIWSKEVGSSKKTFTYDGAFRMVRLDEPETKRAVTTSYSAQDHILSQTDFRGNTTWHSYDPIGNRKETKLPSQGSEESLLTFQSDIHGNLMSSRAPLGETTENEYNVYRKPTMTRHPDGTETQNIYNTNGTLAQTIHADGTKVRFTHDSLHRQTKKETFTSAGELLEREEWIYGSFQLLRYTDPRGLITHYCYDGAGRKIREEASNRSTLFFYDSLGFLERVENSGIAKVQKHNEEGLVTEQWEEDAFGHKKNHMRFFYDEENRKVKAIRQTSQKEAVDSFAYQDNLLSQHIDPEGNTMLFDWDHFFENGFGQKVLRKQITDPLGCKTIETYDVAEHLVSKEKTDAEGHTLFREDFGYDLSGHLVERKSLVYKGQDLIREVTATFAYDEMGRVVEQIEGGSKTTRFSYNSRGDLETKILPSGEMLTYSYDPLRRLTRLKSRDSSIDLHYLYRKGPDPIRIEDRAANTSIDRKYNLFGDLVLEVCSERGETSWAYDSLGRMTQFTLPDGSGVSYEMEGMHLQKITRTAKDGSPLYEHSYTSFDPNGHVQEEALPFRLGSIVTSRDLLERPIHKASSFMELSAAYNEIGLCIHEQNSLTTDKSYQYDDLRQLTQENGKSFSFDSLGNPLGAEVNDLNQLLAVEGTSLRYDADGNLQEKLSQNGVRQYTFDALGRLTQIATPGQKTVHFTYDPLSRLLSKSVEIHSQQAQSAPSKRYYLYDRDCEIGQMDEEREIQELKVLGIGLLGEIGSTISIEVQGEVFMPLHDFRGNIIALLSQEGDILETYEMDSFGKETSSSATSPWRFASKRSEEGLVFFGQRFYDPDLGRWLSPDPLGFVEGMNLYLFVQNSPTNRLDLFGLFSEENFIEPIYVEVPLILSSLPNIPGMQTVHAEALFSGVQVDFVICSGQWHKLQFSAQELAAGTADLMNHLHEMTPSEGEMFGIVTVGNGINTSLEEFEVMASQVSKKVGDTLLIGLYNPSSGFKADVNRVSIERCGVETPIVCHERQFLATLGEKLYAINPQALILSIPHSENGLIMRMAIDGMNDSQKAILQKNLHIFAVGPAEAIPNNFGKSVINVYSSSDYVTGFGPYGRARQYMGDKNYDVRIVQCELSRWQRGFFINDHSFLDATYRKAWSDHIRDIRREIEFYGGEGAKN